MATYPGVDLSATVEAGACDHGGSEPSGAAEFGTVIILGSYPYEATIRVYAIFSSAPDVQEDVYTSAGGLAGQYLGTIELPTPTSVRLKVRRLGGFPKGAMTVYVERA